MTLHEARATLRRRWIDAGYFSGRTLADAIHEGAQKHPEEPIVFHSADRHVTTTIGDLYEQAMDVAAAFQSFGVGPGDVVAMQVPNWPEGVVAHAAAVLAGATMLPIVGTYGAHELRFILRQSGARLLVLPSSARSRDYAAMLPDLGPLPALKTIVMIGENTVAGTVRWADLRGLGGELVPHHVEAADRCLLVYTSGTTAEPKGVQHSHESLLAELESMVIVRQSGPEFVHLAVLPSGHVAGVLGILRPIVHGTRSVFMDAWDAAAAAALVERHQVTSSVGAPVHLTSLLDAAERDGRDLSSLTEYMTGAASVPPAVVERAAAVGIVAYRTYGSSEHPTISSGQPSDPAIKRSTTDGRICEGSEVRIVDDLGSDLPSGQEGEILCRGPEQFLGYLDSSLDESVYCDSGWLRTGDVGVLDVDGYLTVTDRKKDIIVRGGENISSKEVEDIALTCPQILGAAAVAAPDERLGERVCLFVEIVPGSAIELEQLQEHFAAVGAARHKAPEQLITVDALPRTPAGKIRKFVLRDRVRAQARQPAGHAD